MTKVQAQLKELGVAEADMTTSNSSHLPGLRLEEVARRAVAEREGAARSTTPASSSTAANAAGADGVGGPSFSVDDTRAAYASALRQAIEDARAKAEAAAAQMGVKVGGVVSVDDQAGGIRRRCSRRRARQGVGAPTAAPTPVPIAPGTQEIGATVTVVFTYTA